MLKRLQFRFIVVAMFFMVLVLVGTLAATYATTDSTLDQALENSLNRVLNTTTPTRPFIGLLEAPHGDETVYGQRAVVWVDIESEIGRAHV